MELKTDLKKLWHGNGGFLVPNPTKQATEAYSDEYERVITTLTTPSGELTAVCFQWNKRYEWYH